MPAKRTPPTGKSKAPSQAAGKRQPAAEPAHSLPAFPLLVLAVAILGHLFLYYGSDRFEGPASSELRAGPRQASLYFIFAPDQLFLMWCGGKLAYFSLLDRWPIAALAAVILGGAWLAGRLALRLVGLSAALDRLEGSVLGIGVGLNLMSLYALAVGLAGGLTQRWAFVAPLALLAMANFFIKPAPATARPSPGPPDGGPPSPRGRGFDDLHWYWWLLGAAPFALVIVLGGMLPPFAYDVREYHLQAPKEWFQSGRIGFLPHNIYANMPLGSELLSLWAMSLVGGKDGWWWGAITGKTVMATYSLVAAAGLIGLGRRVHSLAAGVIAAVVYLSTPWTVSLAVVGYNEGPVAMYALLAIYSLYLASCDESKTGPAGFALLAGFFAGSAVACKYPPLLFLVIPLLIWVAGRWCFETVWSLVIGHWSLVIRHGRKNILLPAAAFLLGAAVACGLWFAKNAVLTRNPTYPLLYSLFDGATRTPEKDRQWTRVHSPQPDSQGNRFSLHELANQIAWIGWRTKWASMVVIPLALVAGFNPRTRGLTAALLLWMLFVFAVWWLFTHRLDRFLVLLLPAAALLAALGAVAVRHPAWRLTTLSFVALSLVAQFPLVTLPFAGDNRFFAPLAGLRRDDLDLGILAGQRVDFAHRWLNANVPPGQKVLLVGDAEPFDLEVPAIYNTCFDDCQFTRLFQGKTREERLAALRKARISHIFFSWTHLARYRSPGNYGYTSDYPTPELVHSELVEEQRLLRRISIESMKSEIGEVFEVLYE